MDLVLTQVRLFQEKYMPKKKLTKAQVKRKLKTILSNMTDLLMDKAGYPDSHCTVSAKTMLEMSGSISRALKRIK